MASSLLAIDLSDGTSDTIAELDGAPPLPTRPLVTWSADGQWISLLFFDRDIRLIDATKPDTTIALTGVIPQTTIPWPPVEPHVRARC